MEKLKLKLKNFDKLEKLLLKVHLTQSVLKLVS
jgi:hypothetical protein